MKILFCTDGSIISYCAIKNFSKWFKNISVDIFCAADWSFLPDNIAVMDGDFAQKCANSTDDILDYSEKFLSKNGIHFDKKLKLCGSTADSIAEISTNDKYDFIVLGSNGKKGIQKWLGSVSQEVASSSKISAYISKKENSAKNILFAIDDSDVTYNEIRKIIPKFDFYDKNIFLTTVYESPDYLFLEGNIDSNWVDEVNKKQKIHSELLLSKYKELFAQYSVNIFKSVILNGNPSEQIIKYSFLENIDLVVCVVRNRNKLSKILLSSVSRRILENTMSDMFLIKTNNPKQ